MKLIVQFIRQRPRQTAVLVVALLVAGAADGIGLSAMLPLMNLAFDSAADTGADESASALQQSVEQGLETLGLEPTIGILLTVLVLGIGLKNLLVFLTERGIGHIAADVSTDLRLRLLHALTASRWRYFLNQSVGELANAMATEPWRASMAYVIALKLFTVVIETGVYAALALAASWQATLACLGASLVILAASHGLVLLSQRAGIGQTRSYRTLLGTLTDVLQSVKSFKAVGRESIADSLFLRQTRKLQRHLRLEALGTAALNAVQEPLFTIAIAVGIYVAIVQLSMEIATVGFLALILAKLMNQAGKVQKQYQRLMTCDSAYWSLLETIERAEAEAEPLTGLGRPTLARGIEFRNVSFAYPGHTVLDDVSLTVPASGLTCLIGESGTGKSTIADLIIGLMHPDSGSVLVDDVPLGELDLRAWRRTLGYVPQENLLLNDSVFSNVALGVEDAPRDSVERALRAAGAWDFVARMPQGMESSVGERGAILSGGQRQRIMLARALVHRPQLLILDEATSALDPESEADLCRTLSTLKQTLTILAVSHRSALMGIADRVYRLDRGGIEEVPNTSRTIAGHR